MFNGESNSNFEDWIPALERCALWNAWSEEETLLQLAGHLRGRALEEWNLIDECDKRDLSRAKLILRKWLDPGSKMLDACRASQRRGESAPTQSSLLVPNTALQEDKEKDMITPKAGVTVPNRKYKRKGTNTRP